MVDIYDASIDQIIAGYKYENEAYACLSCGKQFEEGEIFKIGERFFQAGRAAQMHVEVEHPDRFHKLINEYLSLTDNQKELFLMFHNGMSDNEIAKKHNVSASTVRHQKFIFREKAKAAKLYSAAWDMADRRMGLLPVHKGATMVDERYVITEEECSKILVNVFETLEPLKLKIFSAKEKKKIVILRRISEQFESGRKYMEKEVNEILKAIYDDYATLRRYLIEYGFMERTSDCRTYWKK